MRGSRQLIAPERFGLYDRLIFALFVLVLPPIVATTPRLFGDGDVSWHIAAGRWILEHGRVPATDPFSFSMAGKPWVAHEWLAEVVYAGAFDLAGHAGLAAVVTIAVMALNAIVFLHLRPRVGPVGLLVALLAMDVILRPFFYARPHVLVWPLLAFWTAALLSARDRGRRSTSTACSRGSRSGARSTSRRCACSPPSWSRSSTCRSTSAAPPF